ncbi:10609_t:CDS:1, partial [Acaulospora morrowiae]
QIEMIRLLKDKVPKYIIMREFHINEYRVDNIWKNRECQQQIVQSTISTLVLSISSENFNQIGRETLYPESITPLNTEMKKRNFKSWSKSIHISDPIPSSNSILVNTDDFIAKQWLSKPTKKISSEDLDVLYEKKARRDERNKAKMTAY